MFDFLNLFIYLFWSSLGLGCYAWAFSSYREQGTSKETSVGSGSMWHFPSVGGAPETAYGAHPWARFTVVLWFLLAVTRAQALGHPSRLHGLWRVDSVVALTGARVQPQ